MEFNKFVRMTRKWWQNFENNFLGSPTHSPLAHFQTYCLDIGVLKKIS